MIPELRIVGHCDGVLQLPDGRWVVLEIKTINTAGFGFLKGPKIDHERQVQLYLHALDRPIRDDQDGRDIRGPRQSKDRAVVLPEVQDGVVLYLNKNNQLERECWVRKADQPIADIRSTLAEAIGSSTNGWLSARLDLCKHAATPRARGCPAVDACFALNKSVRGWKELQAATPEEVLSV